MIGCLPAYSVSNCGNISTDQKSWDWVRVEARECTLAENSYPGFPGKEENDEYRPGSSVLC